MPKVIDLFAGPGGWDEGLRLLGQTDVLGIEWNGDACETARAAGHARLQADIAELDPREYPAAGLIASPPCQSFSAAGKGAGRASRERLIGAIDDMAEGRDARSHLLAEGVDPRAVLVLEPLRWALATEPEWVALEQVPAVLPLWERMAHVLRAVGYSVDTGYLTAEQYGVPQTRKRAFLVASRKREAGLPVPTHRKYRKGVRQHEGDPSLLPWVSMAEALGWGMTQRPSMTVTGGGGATGGAEPFGNAARKGMRRELDAGRWQPSHMAQAGAACRVVDPRPAEAPAGTITGKGTAAWMYERPATTVQGDARIAAPGHKCRAVGCCPGRDPESMFSGESVRVTVQEAAVLQSFRPDYPWRGTKTSQYQRVGDAVPPLMAAVVANAAMGSIALSPPTVEGRM